MWCIQKFSTLAALVALTFFAFAVLARSVQIVLTPRENVFTRYADYLPGAPDDALYSRCSVYPIPGQSIYAVCTNVGDEFRWIYASAHDGVINSTTFFPASRSIYLPDLLRWFGGYEKFNRGRYSSFVRWPNGAVAYFREWHGMMSPPYSIYIRSLIDVK